MKLVILSLIFGMVLSTASAQIPNSFDKQAIEMLHNFYKAYISIDPSTAISVDEMPIRKKYCTSKFLDKYYYHPKEEDQLDSDPFVKAQDSDPSWLKTLTINIAPNEPHWYVAEYTDMTTFAHTVIHLKVVKQGVRYLIAETR